nr:hypothetical protein [Tanacetum cinerariifolium]
MALKLLVSVVKTVVGALLDALDLFLGFLGGGGGIGSVVMVAVGCYWWRVSHTLLLLHLMINDGSRESKKKGYQEKMI